MPLIFKQSLYRQIQSEELVHAYNDNNDLSFKIFFHKLATLAYVPIADVVKTFLQLKTTAPAIASVSLWSASGSATKICNPVMESVQRRPWRLGYHE